MSTIKIKRLFLGTSLLALIAIFLANPSIIIKIHKSLYVKYVRITKSDFASRFNENKLEMAMHHAANEPWVNEQITADLEPFKNGISHKQIATWFKELQHPTENKLVKFKIIDSEVQVSASDDLIKSRAYKTVHSVIQMLASRGHIPNCEFIVALNDYLAYIPDQIKEPVAIFSFAKHTEIPIENSTILIPDWMNVRYWDILRKRIDLANRLYPWQRKKNSIHWRGGMADSMQHRQKLIDISSKFNFLDVGFTEGLNPAKYVDPEFSIQYKYQIALDGSRCTWERMVWQMHSNTVLIKPFSPQIQWYHRALKPYQNYIPIADVNESQVAFAYDWLRKNDTSARVIMQNANIFAEENLKTEDFFAYYAILLQEYSKLMTS